MLSNPLSSDHLNDVNKVSDVELEPLDPQGGSLAAQTIKLVIITFMCLFTASLPCLSLQQKPMRAKTMLYPISPSTAPST